MSGFPARRVLWAGDDAAAAELTPDLRDAGFECARVMARGDVPSDGGWALVIFLAQSSNWDELADLVCAGLDHGINVVVVEPKDEAGGATLPGQWALGSRLGRRNIFFSDAEQKDPDTQQSLRGLALRGGELRRVGFGKGPLLTGIDHPALVLTENESVDIQPRGRKLDDDARSLMQCAFSDCLTITVRRLHGGRAALGVYEVVAMSGIPGDVPLPFVAKIGTRAEIITETRKFESRVRDFVPFANRPNFLLDRSFVRATQGILVGQFVQHSATIDSAIRHDGAGGALHELFSSVLHRWWTNSFLANNTSYASLGAAGLERWFNPDAHPTKRDQRSRARATHHSLAEQLELDVLDDATIKAAFAKKLVWRLGRTHGDMNCGNVLVSGGAALVIDFTHCNDGPLLADPTWLEVNLVFNWQVDSPAEALEWRDVVEMLYAPAAFDGPPPPHYGDKLGTALSRLCGAVHFIRRHAIVACCGRQDYPLVLAAALLRFASLEAVGDGDEARAETIRRARAYASACRILRSV